MSECIFGWGKQHGTMPQDQAPRYCRRGCRFPAQSHRLQSRAHPQAHRRLRLESVRKPQIAPKAEGNPTKQREQLQSSMFFSKLLDDFGRNVHQLWLLPHKGILIFSPSKIAVTLSWISSPADIKRSAAMRISLAIKSLTGLSAVVVATAMTVPAQAYEEGTVSGGGSITEIGRASWRERV